VLPPLLCEPSLYSTSQAVALSKMARRVEPGLDSLLARWLSAGHDFDRAAEQSAIRCLEILSEIAEGGRIRPLLIQLLRSRNRRVRSKTALVIGSLHSNVAWFLDLIRKGDPRVAANALEGAWNANWRGAHEVFLEGISSRHPRVAGNAIVGLSLLGEKIEALKEAERIAAGPDPHMRATGAWAMGEIGSPLSMPCLQSLVRDADSAVKRNALRALARIRNRVSAGSQPAATPADAPAAPPPS
jgi:HEAT repeat protein